MDLHRAGFGELVFSEHLLCKESPHQRKAPQRHNSHCPVRNGLWCAFCKWGNGGSEPGKHWVGKPRGADKYGWVWNMAGDLPLWKGPLGWVASTAGSALTHPVPWGALWASVSSSFTWRPARLPYGVALRLQQASWLGLEPGAESAVRKPGETDAGENPMREDGPFHLSLCSLPCHRRLELTRILQTFWPHLTLLFICFGHCHPVCGILVPQPGIEPMPPAVEARSPNQGTLVSF